MDLETRSDKETIRAYRLIRRVNHFLGGTRVTLSHLKQYSKRWDKNDCIRILDVAAGIADIPQAIVRWARKKGFHVTVVALDINPQVTSYAKQELHHYPEINLIRASIFEIPFATQSFDYVITSQFFHHLNEEEVLRVLKIFSLLAKRGIIVNDLMRRIRAYLWIHFFSRFTTNEIFRNDAPLSVRRGFCREEVQKIIQESGLDYLKFYHHPYHRFAIAGERI